MLKRGISVLCRGLARPWIQLEERALTGQQVAVDHFELEQFETTGG